MYIVFAKNTPYGKNIIQHREVPFNTRIADRHIARLNALKVGQGKRKQPLHWSWAAPEWFQQQVDQGRLVIKGKGVGRRQTQAGGFDPFEIFDQLSRGDTTHFNI